MQKIERRPPDVDVALTLVAEFARQLLGDHHAVATNPRVGFEISRSPGIRGDAGVMQFNNQLGRT